MECVLVAAFTPKVLHGSTQIVIRQLRHEIVDGTTLKALGTHDAPPLIVEVGVSAPDHGVDAPGPDEGSGPDEPAEIQTVLIIF